MEAPVENLVFLKNPKAKIGLIAAAIVIGIYLLTGSWLNSINTYEQTINTNFVSLKENCDRRTALIPRFIELLQYFAPNSQDIQRQMNQVYQQAKTPTEMSILTNKEQMQAFLSRQTQVTQVLNYMVTQADNTPAISQNRQFLLLKMQLLSLEQQINYTVVILNQSIIIYNSFLTGFPKEWLNTLFLGHQQKELIQISSTLSNKQ